MNPAAPWDRLMFRERGVTSGTSDHHGQNPHDARGRHRNLCRRLLNLSLSWVSKEMADGRPSPPLVEIKANVMTGTYRVYGLTIASEIDLPELPLARVDTGSADSPDAGAVDVTILQDADLRRPDADAEPGWTQISPFAWSAQEAFHLEVPDIVSFRISDGSRVRVCPAPGIDAASVRVFLLGSALAALLFQRSLLVLHGNAMVIDGQAMICIGPSGAGKSTLAAAFAARGYSVLADDVVAIDANCAALPGIPRIKLWQDSASRLNVDTSGLMRIRPSLEKFHLPLPVQAAAQVPLPVRWIYLLGKGNAGSFTLTPVSGFARFQPLMANTYRRRFMEGMALHPVHLTRCGELAGRVHMAQVVRPKSGFDIDGLVDHL